MIDFYYWMTPNGHKIAIMLEELGVDYNLIPVDIGKGDQFKDDFVEISPSNRIPAIIDHAPLEQDNPVSIFESGAILLYLADKYQQFISTDFLPRKEIMEWLFWQMGGLGPMLGQNHHFGYYMEKEIPYAIDRYVKETTRLYAILNKRLDGREFITDSYTIADIACYPWIQRHPRQRIDIQDFPNVYRWYCQIHDRPAVVKAYDLVEQIEGKEGIDQAAAKILFGQDKSVVK